MNSQTQLEGSKRVMIVDDDETVLMLAESILTVEGFEVTTCSSPVQALDQVDEIAPDILVLDVLMPDLNGFDFCSQLRSRLKKSDLPILMATSLDDPHSINRAYEAGATDFAVKPLNWTIEVHRLRYMLRASETAAMLKSQELEARKAKEDWERTFSAISDMISILSPELKVIRANPATARMLNLPMDQILGVECHKLFQNSDSRCENCPVLRSMAENKPFSYEKKYLNPPMECQVTGAVVNDSNGRLDHVVHIARDLTRQKQLEAEFRHAQKMEAVGTLAGGVAHDFNNLLTVVSFSINEIEYEFESKNDGIKEFTTVISQAVKRGAELANQLLTFSRKGIPIVEKKVLQLNQVVQETEKLIHTLMSKSVRVELNLDADLKEVFASGPQLQQVLVNLAVNASHAMPDGGVFTIETHNVRFDMEILEPAAAEPGKETHVLMEVHDTGHGMDHKTVQRVFEPFFTTKEVGKGTGLGLAVVYGIVKDHGGHIQCLSDVGVGTSFKIYLPVVCETQLNNPPVHQASETATT